MRWNLKKLLSTLISALSKLSQWTLSRKKKVINLPPKMPYLVVFASEFQKPVVIFEINFIKFFQLQNFSVKQKCLNVGSKCLIWVFLTKDTLFGYFSARILNFFCYIRKQHPWISLFAKSPRKKNAYVWDEKCLKIAIFECFWLKMPYLGFFGI